MAGTCVIIPYFQRKPGLLTAAIRSALAQEQVGLITVIVCDDASPVRAETELALLGPEQRDHVILITQPNAGAGPARNTALDAIPPGTEWIAFLDSDDKWETVHLARAQAALQAGYDLYFGDALRESQTQTHFQAAAFDLSKHTPINSLPGMFEFVGNFLTENIVMSPVSISTVVMRASTLGDLRFKKIAFEDLVFWFEMATRPVRIAFDSTLQVHYGRGDITLADSWISQKALKICLLYNIVFMLVMRDFKLTSVQRVLLKARITHNRRDFGRIVLGLLRYRRIPAWPVMMEVLRLDPWIIRSIMGVAMTELARHLPFHRRASTRRSG